VERGAAGPRTTNLNGVVGADAEHAAAADGHGGGERAGGVGGVDGGVGQYHVGEAAPRRPCEGRRRAELSFPAEEGMTQGRTRLAGGGDGREEEEERAYMGGGKRGRGGGRQRRQPQAPRSRRRGERSGRAWCRPALLAGSGGSGNLNLSNYPFRMVLDTVYDFSRIPEYFKLSLHYY
jgi:hypothetical protein